MNDAQRKIRFKVESLPASIDTKLEGDFHESIHCVVINESFSGVCLITRNDGVLLKDKIIRVKVGAINPVKAKIIWIEEVEAEIIKLGIEYQK